MAEAQSTLDALQEELNEAKQTHQEVTTQVESNFFAQLDPAMGSPDAALDLYQKAGGELPDKSPVVKQNNEETATEKDARENRDQVAQLRLGTALQLHCGLMHYAALLLLKPDKPGLHEDWINWLKAAAQTYPQLAMPKQSNALPSDPRKKKKEQDNEIPDDAPAPPPPPPPPYNPADVLGRSMRDSNISKYLLFNAWDDKEQGGWSVRNLPDLYRNNVLEPLRKSPTPATLEAWDIYIAMANADQTDADKWEQVDFPPMQFDRGCDDYAVSPSTEKLEGLVNLIKANPTNPHADDWIARVSQLMGDYRAQHGGVPAASTPAPAPVSPGGNPAVTITTQQQGDATIITTHSNSAPVSPAPPTR